jgi:hypothetical protein
MGADNQSLTSDIKGQRADAPITFYVWPRDVDVYQVFDSEFNTIKSAATQSGLYLTFSGIVFGLMVALLITLVTVTISDPRIFACFVVGFGASVIATALLGFKAISEYRETQNQIESIKQKSRGRRIEQGAITPPT